MTYPQLYSFYSTLSVMTIFQMPSSSLKKVIAIVYLFCKTFQHARLHYLYRAYPGDGRNLPRFFRSRVGPIMTDLIAYTILRDCSYRPLTSICCSTLMGGIYNFSFKRKKTLKPYLIFKVLHLFLSLKQQHFSLDPSFQPSYFQTIQKLEWVTLLQAPFKILLPFMVAWKAHQIILVFFSRKKWATLGISASISLPLIYLMSFERNSIKIPSLALYFGWYFYKMNPQWVSRLSDSFLQTKMKFQNWWNLPSLVQHLQAEVQALRTSVSRLEQKKHNEEQELKRLHNQWVDPKT